MQAQALYDPANEHDACGVGLVANINNVASHEIVTQGITVLNVFSTVVQRVATQKQVMVLVFSFRCRTSSSARFIATSRNVTAWQ